MAITSRCCRDTKCTIWFPTSADVSCGTNQTNQFAYECDNFTAGLAASSCCSCFTCDLSCQPSIQLLPQYTNHRPSPHEHCLLVKLHLLQQIQPGLLLHQQNLGSNHWVATRCRWLGGFQLGRDWFHAWGSMRSLAAMRQSCTCTGPAQKIKTFSGQVKLLATIRSWHAKRNNRLLLPADCGYAWTTRHLQLLQAQSVQGTVTWVRLVKAGSLPCIPSWLWFSPSHFFLKIGSNAEISTCPPQWANCWAQWLTVALNDWAHTWFHGIRAQSHRVACQFCQVAHSELPEVSRIGELLDQRLLSDVEL